MSYKPDKLQRIAISLMGALVLVTFAATNIQALLWQSSDWLVGAVLPGVVVELTNDERSDVAAKPLSRNATLDAAAQLKAQHMAKNQYFAHYAPDGTTPWHWFNESGYTYAHAGENLAIHFTDSEEVVEAWMNSPTHRANIVDSKFTEIGVGTAKGRFDGHNTVYVVQLFGTPAYVPPAPIPTPSESLAVATEAVTATEPAAPPETVLAAVDELPEEVAVTSIETEEEPVNPAAEEPSLVANESTTTMTNLSDIPEESMAENEEVIQEEYSEQPQMVRESMVATSSGLAVASVGTTPTETTSSFISLATQPNTVMQIVYTLIALAVFVLLILSFVNEMHHAHPIQMGYSVAMLFLMVGLYWLHSNLTQGAIVV